MIWPETGFFPFAKFLGDGFRAGIVETHAVYNCLVRDNAEHSWRRISRLRVPRHAAEFAETKAKFFPSGNGGGKFVHAGGKPDWIWKFQAENFHGQFWCRINASNNTASERTPAGTTEEFERGIMSAFCVLCEEKRANQFSIRPAHLIFSKKLFVR